MLLRRNHLICSLCFVLVLSDVAIPTTAKKSKRDGDKPIDKERDDYHKTIGPSTKNLRFLRTESNGDSGLGLYAKTFTQALNLGGSLLEIANRFFPIPDTVSKGLLSLKKAAHDTLSFIGPFIGYDEDDECNKDEDDYFDEDDDYEDVDDDDDYDDDSEKRRKRRKKGKRKKNKKSKKNRWAL